MSIFRRAVSAARLSAIQSGEPFSDSEAVDIFSDGGSGPPLSGKRMTRSRALQMMAVWRCVSLLAGGVSGLPSDTFTKKDGLTVESPMPIWLKKPQVWQAPMDFWHRVMVSLLLDGNAFIWTKRNDAGRIIGLEVLNPRLVHVETTADGSDIRFQIQGEWFDRSWILWIPAFTVDWQLRGLSPISAAKAAIDLGLTVEEYGARFFHQGASMSGVIQHPGNPDPDQANMLRKMFRKKHSGINNSHAIGILTGGAEWKNITITPEEAQFLETRRFQKGEIALLFGVPPHMVDPTVASSWGSGVEEMNRFFNTFSLQDWITRLEQYVTLFLLPGYQFFKFNVDARLRPNMKERYAAYKSAIETGWMNKDEARNKEDMQPIPDGLGEVFYRPLNFAPLGVGPYEGSDPNGDGVVDPHLDEYGRKPTDPDYGKPIPTEDPLAANTKEGN